MFQSSKTLKVLLEITVLVVVVSNYSPDISDYEFEKIDDVIQSFNSYPNEDMWSTVPEVSESHPLIFFHQRKSGGTSIRGSLIKAAEKANISYYIPCYAGVSCDTYSIPTKTPFPIYAGHFSWDVHSTLERLRQNGRHQFSCVTNFREPVSRLTSCLFFRFHKELHMHKCVNDIPISVLYKFLNQVDMFGSSCRNEPFRILSGNLDEDLLDNLQNSRFEDGRRRYLLQEQALGIFHATLMHVKKCAPVVLEIPQSVELANRRFPMLESPFGGEKLQVNQFHQGCPKASGAHLTALRNISQLESLLYNAVFNKTWTRVREVFGRRLS
mmetsp:Transcript_17267/g.25800  ORF Transcript_17267/g.25800 Transcript_17267/m.25800 type:complete len:326 (-) Transcript_17267:230-1207(-)